jgi:WD40 repeat protein
MPQAVLLNTPRVGRAWAWVAVTVLAWLAPPAAAEPPLPADAKEALDAQGDPLPAGALARLGTVRFRHCGDIDVLALSADGKVLATGAGDNVIRLWDAATGKPLRRFEKLSAAGAAYCVALSPDGKVLAAPAQSDGAGVSEQVVLFDTATGKELRRLGEPLGSLCAQLAFSPDGKAVAASEWQAGKVHVWDAATGKEVALWKAHEPWKGFGRSIAAVVFSADGKRLVTAGAGDKVVRLWDAATGKAVRSFTGHAGGVHCAALSPDGRLLATGSADATARLWDVATGEELRVLSGFRHGVAAVAFSPDGKTLLTGSEGPSKVWEVATGKQVRELPGDRGWLAGAFFTPDGKRVVTGGGRLVHVRDAVTGRDVHAFAGHEDSLHGLAFSPDGKLLATAGADRTVRLWSGAKEVRRLTVAGESGVWSPAFAPDGKALAGATFTHIHLWDPEAGRELRKWEAIKEGDGITPGLAFAPDGRSLASAGFGPPVRLWDPATGKELRRIDGRAWSLAFSPDGKLLAGGGVGGQPVRLRVWDPAGGKAAAEFPEGDSVSAVAFSPDGKLLAAADSLDYTVRLWDAERRTLVRTWKADDGPYGLCALSFSPDGRMLVTGSQTRTAGKSSAAAYAVRVWEVRTGKERCSFRGHEDTIAAVAVSPDGAVIASASADTTALLWDLAGRGPAAALTADELAGLWSDLASEDAERAFRAVQRLARAPGQAVALLGPKVAARPAEPKRVARLIADLDSDDFATREKASQELGTLDDAAESEMRDALKGERSTESRRRLEELLAGLKAWPPERLRVARALEALERVGTPKAREVLKALAEESPRTWRGRDARAALKRLDR